MNHEALASQLLRALRGRHSQAALSRRLEYRSNAFKIWESGRAFPSAARTFAIAKRVGKDTRVGLMRFLGKTAPSMLGVDLTTGAGVARLLRHLRGRMRVGAIAEATGRDRYAISRWLKGTTQPRLPDLLRLVDAMTHRLPDFVAILVDPSELPEVAETWALLERSRQVARTLPWSHAVLRALELEQYRALPQHEEGWLGAYLGLGLENEKHCLQALQASHQIRWNGSHWEATHALTVDARGDPEAGRNLAVWGAELGATRIAAGGTGYAFNLIAISAKDLQRLRRLQQEYFAQLRAIVAASEPAEHVAIVNMHLLDLNAQESLQSA